MKISVAMAYYNGGTYIEEQMDSILSQLGEKDEVIVSVDGASDGSKPLLLKMAEVDSRIHIVTEILYICLIRMTYGSQIKSRK